ncbi:MAG: hypothetical protein QOH97_185 [Actinoplanes sp.]|nr:hypothetical protein [Actinoplanes sp.]
MIDLREPEPITRHRRSGRPMGVLIAAAAVLVLLLGVAFVLYRSRSTRALSPVADAAAAAVPVASPAAPATTPAGPAPSAKQATSTPPAAAKPAVPTVAGGVPAPPAGFTLTFADAFGGAAGTGLNRQIFRYATGPGSTFGTGEIETMTDSTGNVFHDGQGQLMLRALHAGSDPGQGWTSGRFETRAATFGAAKGGVVRMQASIQQPNVSTATGAGYWPAFWMLGNGLRTGGTWPRIGEVDILEDVNGRGSVFGTLHCGVNPGGPCNESSGVGSGERPCAGCQSGPHTYAVEIDRSTSVEQIRWYLDGRAYFTLSQSRIDAKTWADAVDHPFYIIFDLAIGGGFPGAFGGGPNARTVSGGSMKIDYVAVYNKG